MDKTKNSNSKVLEKKNKIKYPTFKKNNQINKIYSDLKKKINEISLNQNKNMTNYYLTKNLSRNYGINHNKKEKKSNNSFIIDINSIEKEIIKENFEKKNIEKSTNENKKMRRSNSSTNNLSNNKFTLFNNNNNKQKNHLNNSSSYVKIYLNKNNCLKSNEIKKYNILRKNLTAEKEKSKLEKNEKKDIKKNILNNGVDYIENKPLNLNKISRMNKKKNEIRMLYNICLLRKKMIPQVQEYYYNENINNSYNSINEKNIQYPIYNNESKNSFQIYKTQIRNFDRLNNLIPEEKEDITDSAKELIEKKNKIINEIITKSGVNIKI